MALPVSIQSADNRVRSDMQMLRFFAVEPVQTQSLESLIPALCADLNKLRDELWTYYWNEVRPGEKNGRTDTRLAQAS